MKKITPLVLALFLAASGAQASLLSPIVKLSEKAATRGATGAAVRAAAHEAGDAARLALHESDDLAKVGAKAGAKTVVEASARTAKMVDRAVEAERAAVRAGTPRVPEIHRAPIKPPSTLPKTVLAGGAAVAGTVAAYNLTAGEREKDEAAADALRNDPEAAAKYANGGLLHMLGAGGARALVILAWFVGGGIGLVSVARAFRARPVRRPAVIDVTPATFADPR